jgi:hypothetical protein
MSMTIWQELGIDATSDADTIKDAYAARLGLMRPDKDLNQFLRLRSAYTAALQMADSIGDAESWLENTRRQAKSWKYWIGQREPAAARILLGSRPVALTWFAPPEPYLSWKLAEVLLHESQFADVIDAERIKGILPILLTRRRRSARALILAGKVAFWFALAIIGLYFTPLATMGVIIIAFVWGRMPASIRFTYRTELIFPLVALVWVLLSILYAETFLSPPTYGD